MRPSNSKQILTISTFVLIISVVLSSVPATAASSKIEIGRNGGSVILESDLQIAMGQGGGHIKWRISGAAAPEMKRIVDRNFGNDDGNITPSEASGYTTNLDNLLTSSSIIYHGAKLQSFSLLDRNRGVEDNTDGFIGNVTTKETMEIRFLIEATMDNQDRNFDLNDDVLITSLFDALRSNYDNHTYVFVGKVELTHINTIVGMNSYSNFDTDHGYSLRFRGPLWEIYRYSVSYDGGSMKNAKDKAIYDPFNIIQSPLELFIVVVMLGYFTLYTPKRHARIKRMTKVKPLHRLALGLVSLDLVIYFVGWDGILLWIFAPLFLVIIYLLSYQIYVKGWKGIAKPLSDSERIEIDREEGIIRPQSYKKLGPSRGRKPPPRRRSPSRPPPRGARDRDRRPPRREYDDHYHERGDGHYHERDDGYYDDRDEGHYHERGDEHYHERDDGYYDDRDEGHYHERGDEHYHERGDGYYDDRDDEHYVYDGAHHRREKDYGRDDHDRDTKDDRYDERPPRRPQRDRDRPIGNRRPRETLQHKGPEPRPEHRAPQKAPLKRGARVPPSPKPRSIPSALPPPGPPLRKEASNDDKDMDDLDIPGLSALEMTIEKKKIRCSQCNDIFVAEIIERPMTVECPKCGKRGMIR